MDSINFPSHVNVTKFHPLVTCTWTARTTPQSSSSRKSKPTATAAAALANAVKSYYVTIFKMDTEHANATASLCLRVDGKQKACSSGDGDDQVGLVLPVRDVSASNELNVSIVLMLTNAKDNGWGRARATGSYSVDSLTGKTEDILYPRARETIDFIVFLDPCKDPAPLPLERGMYYYNPTRRDCSRFRGEKSEAKSEKFHGTPFGSKNDCRKTCGGKRGESTARLVNIIVIHMPRLFTLVDSRPSSQIFARTQRMPTQVRCHMMFLRLMRI